jgi:hypothetical protein
MCICASESSRPRFFNWVSVVLITTWVLIVSAVAHTVPSDLSTEQNSVMNVVETFADLKK